MNTVLNLRKKLDAADSRAVTFSRYAVAQILCFLTAALLSSVRGTGFVSPFGVAFSVSSGKKHLIPSCLGAAAGYMLSNDSLPALRYICAVLCSAVLISLLSRFESVSKFRLLEACTAFLMLFLTGMTVAFAGAVSIEVFAAVLVESCVGFAGAYVFAGAGDSVSEFLNRGVLQRREILLIIISIFLILLSLSEITVFSVSFSRIIMLLIILVSGAVPGNIAPAAAAAAGLVFSADAGVSAAAIAYCAAGLALSIFSNGSRLFKTAVFFVCCAVTFTLLSAEGGRLYLTAEALTACAVFVCLPKRFLNAVSDFLFSGGEPERTRSQRRAVISRLETAGEAISGLGGCIDAARRIGSQTQDDSVLLMYAQVRDEVCAQCSRFALCWTKNFSDCRKSFDSMTKTLEGNSRLRADSLPRYLAACCSKKEELRDVFTLRYAEYAAASDTRRQLDRARSVTVEQLGSVRNLFSEISAELSAPISFDSDTADRICSFLDTGFGLKADTVVCTRSRSGHLKIELTFPEKPLKLDTAGLLAGLEEISAAELSPPSVGEHGDFVSIIFEEKTKFRVEAAASRSSADSGSLCGDSYEGFYGSDGNYYAVLSDGMGSGFRAAVDSSVSVTMAASLLRAGFSCESVINLVNSSMLLKQARESFSTLDIIKLDLHTGKAYFVKAGACRSLIRHRNKISEIEISSMPLGILGDVDAGCSCVRLGDGDTVLLTSDGAYEYCDGAVRTSFAVSRRSESVSEISQRILLDAKKARGDRRSDDITVIVLRLRLNK